MFKFYSIAYSPPPPSRCSQTTRSQVAHFCEHYSFVSSIEPYRIEDALRDPDWVVAMQEELNNFTRNEV
jgi:hypothetical protein